VAEKEKELEKIRRELKSKKALSCCLAKKVASTEKDIELEEDGIQQSKEDTIAVLCEKIIKVIADCMKGRHKKTWGQLLAEVVWMGILNGAAMLYLLNLLIQYYRDNLFTPGRVLQVMDLGGGILNLSGIELLHKIEIAQKLPASKRILPTAADIK